MTGAAAGHVWQPSLLGGGEPSCDPGFSNLRRLHLDDHSWVDVVPGWMTGADEVFAALLVAAAWSEHDRVMYGRTVAQPRLTASWSTSAVKAAAPIIEEARALLSDRYGVEFDRGGLNLYRDGHDSVAWHGDRIPAEIVDPLVAIISLGGTRSFRLRPHPKTGRPGLSTAITVRSGDLLVTGGRTQRDWQHAILKTKAADPRISVTFRHGPYSESA